MTEQTTETPVIWDAHYDLSEHELLISLNIFISSFLTKWIGHTKGQ